MFEGWGEFYLLVGAAAATLIGLLFVVVTLTSDRERSSVLHAASLYMSPVVLHLAFVLVLSAAALAPLLSATGFGLVCAALAGIGLGVSVRVTLGIRRSTLASTPHWSDAWCYGVAPACLYLGLAAVSATALAHAAATPGELAAATIGLLLISIRNAWDLVTFLAPRSPREELGEGS